MSILRLFPTLALVLVGAPAIANAQQSASRSQPASVPLTQSSLESFFGRRSLFPAVTDTAARLTCPMPVARPDTTRLERMPRARVDSAKMAPMPVARGCTADAK